MFYVDILNKEQQGWTDVIEHVLEGSKDPSVYKECSFPKNFYKHKTNVPNKAIRHICTS